MVFPTQMNKVRWFASEVMSQGATGEHRLVNWLDMARIGDDYVVNLGLKCLSNLDEHAGVDCGH
jgi:hypothetical protein